MSERKRAGERFSSHVAGSTSAAWSIRSCGRRLTLLREVAGTVVEVLVEVSAMRPLQARAETKV